MNDLTIREINADEIEGLRAMWESLYRHTRAHGMLSDVPPEGFALWASSFAGLWGRLAFAFIAAEQDSVVGFVAGRIRVHPKHFGGQQVGFISELFVSPSYRRRGVGKRMIEAARSWFAERGIARIELQVVAGDHGARAFYVSNGWAEEFVQMVTETKV
jgi:GNAT superfamily N-acetyltransferase